MDKIEELKDTVKEYLTLKYQRLLAETILKVALSQKAIQKKYGSNNRVIDLEQLELLLEVIIAVTPRTAQERNKFNKAIQLVELWLNSLSSKIV